MGVAVGGLDFKNAVADFQNRDVKGTAAKVKNRNLFIVFLVQPIGQGGCGGLIDDSQHVETGNFAGIFGGLTLAVAEISRNGNDRVGNFLAQVFFSRIFDVGQYKG